VTEPEAGGRGPGRIPVTLACSECKARNYKTTRSPTDTTPLEIRKFCKQCKRHTLHRETK
jgi:large subunit ribosomal protein L33